MTARALALVAVVAACGYPDPHLPDRAGSGSDTAGSDGGFDAMPDAAVCPASCTMGCIGLVCAAKINDNQQGVVATRLAQPFIIAVSHTDGTPVDGLHLTFAVQSGGGSVTASDVVTSSGQAQTYLILGSAAGHEAVVVHETGSSDAPVVFGATGLAGPPVMATPENSNQSGTAGAPLGSPFKVTVVDTHGNPTPGIDVTFTVTGGGGTVGGLGSTTVQTDASGVAQVTLTLGTVAGGNSVSAKVAGLPGTTPFAAVGQPGAAATLAIVSGNNQTEAVATALSPFVVALSDANGNAISGATVPFAVTAGVGTLAGTTTTDAQGHAQTTLTLGPTAGTNNNVVTAMVGALSVEFQASATPGPAATLTATIGTNQTAVVASVLSPFEVTVTDAHGNAVSGISVTFAVTAGGGSIPAPATRTSDAQGHVQITLTLGVSAGVNTVIASVTGLTALPINATGIAGPATQLAVSSGNGQSVTVATAAAPFVVVARDAHGNPVAGVAVSFAVTSGGGSLSATSGNTAASGQAQTTLTLGPNSGASNNSVTATANGLTGSPVTFTASGLAGPPASITVSSGDGQTGMAGQSMSQPLVALVSDAHGNPVPGVTVAFHPQLSGFGTPSPSQALADAAGKAQTTLLCGTNVPATPTANNIIASVGGLTVAFNESAVPGPPLQIRIVSGDNQAAEVAALVSLVVQVVDFFNNPIVNNTVAFEVTAGGGTVLPPSSATGSNGQASATLTLGPTPGTNTVAATASGLGSAVTFHATGFPGPVASITAVSGDHQSGEATTMLAQPLVAVVKDAHGNPIPGVTVGFSVTSGGGSVTSPFATTDPAGQVSTLLTLGAAGANTVQVTTGAVSFVFTATGRGLGPPSATFVNAPVAMVLADFNADGRPDIAVQSDGNVAVFLNATAPGATTVTLAQEADFSGPARASAIARCDLDGDGRPDLAMPGVAQDGFTALLNETEPHDQLASFVLDRVSGTRSGSAIACGDIDGDGRPDVVVVGSNSATLYVNRSQPLSLFFSQEPLQAGVSGGDGVVLGDFDGDGRLDIAISDSSANTISVFLNGSSPGNPSISFLRQITAIGGPTGLIVSDLNADGLIDLVEADTRNSTVSVFLNQGNASFSSQQQLNTNFAPVEAVAVGDIDGDGKPDIVATSRSASLVALFVNRTAAGATSIDFLPQISFTKNSGSFAIGLSDFNADGELDVCTLDPFQSTFSILLAD